jgi:hypothetical protein
MNDPTQYLRDFRTKSNSRAFNTLGNTPEAASAQSDSAQNRYTPNAVQLPPSIWRKQASRFILRSHQTLVSNHSLLWQMYQQVLHWELSKTFSLDGIASSVILNCPHLKKSGFQQAS